VRIATGEYARTVLSVAWTSHVERHVANWIVAGEVFDRGRHLEFRSFSAKKHTRKPLIIKTSTQVRRLVVVFAKTMVSRGLAVVVIRVVQSAVVLPVYEY